MATTNARLSANQADLDESSIEGALRDRLLLTPQRIAEMAQMLRDVAKLADPVGEILKEWTRPNGLRIRKVRVPMGVIGIIYESRPNVTVDTVALAVKTGNAIVLRGGKEAAHSNRRLPREGWTGSDPRQGRFRPEEAQKLNNGGTSYRRRRAHAADSGPRLY